MPCLWVWVWWDLFLRMLFLLFGFFLLGLLFLLFLAFLLFKQWSKQLRELPCIGVLWAPQNTTKLKPSSLKSNRILIIPGKTLLHPDCPGDERNFLCKSSHNKGHHWHSVSAASVVQFRTSMIICCVVLSREKTITSLQVTVGSKEPDWKLWDHRVRKLNRIPSHFLATIVSATLSGTASYFSNSMPCIKNVPAKRKDMSLKCEIILTVFKTCKTNHIHFRRIRTALGFKRVILRLTHLCSCFKQMLDEFKVWKPGLQRTRCNVIYILQSYRSGSKPRYCSSLCPWTSFSARQCSWTFLPREQKRWPHAGYYGCQSRSPCHDGCWDLRWCCLCRKEASARSEKSVAVNEIEWTTSTTPKRQQSSSIFKKIQWLDSIGPQYQTTCSVSASNALPGRMTWAHRKNRCVLSWSLHIVYRCNDFTACLPAHFPMPKTEKVTHVLFRCDDLHLHDGLLRFIRIEDLGGLNDKGSHIVRWKTTRRSDTASKTASKMTCFLTFSC